MEKLAKTKTKPVQQLLSQNVNWVINFSYTNKTEHPLVVCNTNVVFANALGVKKYESLNF